MKIKLMCSKCGRTWPSDETKEPSKECKCGAGIKYLEQTTA